MSHSWPKGEQDGAEAAKEAAQCQDGRVDSAVTQVSIAAATAAAVQTCRHPEAVVLEIGDGRALYTRKVNVGTL